MHVQGVMANRQGSGQKVLVAGGDKNLLFVQNFLHSRALWVVPSLLYKKEKAPKFQILGCLDLCMLRLRREFVYK